MNVLWLVCLLVLIAPTVYIFITAARKKLALVMLGTPENRFDQKGSRFRQFVNNVLLGKKLMNEPYGIFHVVIFWGFVFIVLAELPFILEGLLVDTELPTFGIGPIFFMIKDVLAGCVFLGLIGALIRRWIVRPARLYRTFEAFLVVFFIMMIILTDWLFAGARLAMAAEPAPLYELAPFYHLFASAMGNASPSGLEAIANVMWWLHVIILLTFTAYIPNSKHLHLIAAPINSFFASLKPTGGQIAPMDLEDEDATEFGVSRIEGFTWKQLLDSFSCGECGRCMDNCPAQLTGKPLNPKELLARTLKNHLIEKGEVMLKYGLKSTGEENEEKIAEITGENPEDAAILAKSLINDVVTEDVIWSCTTCMSCQIQCPVSNEHVNKIIDMRRYQAMMEGAFTPELETALRNVENNFNPWGIGWSNREDWAKDLGVKLLRDAEDPENVEYLYWVGCAGSFDSRAQKVATATVKILTAAGVDFAILGTEEKCCGDFVRRAGNEYAYQSLVAENVETLNGYKVKKIVTACPHCLNALKNDYPSFDGNYEVFHHTQLINQLITDGKLTLKEEDQLKDAGLEPRTIAYHDSCYLGRYQQEYQAPRDLFARVPGVTLMEMDRHHDKSFCCGAGGGRMWMEETLGTRINQTRVEQALAKDPQAIGANCPFCMTMLEDGVKEKVDPEKGITVVDPAELIVKML
ncbi:MAG: heterodisulfide reductase-related iron-sulfur binding cluster [Peptococcaceae bacterium]|nr:heterodisulfide reductase-related iron-sulfur binding cluster [Peptococcaceae bacterium]